VGSRVLDGDPQEAINIFTIPFITSLTDPGLAELAIEVVLEARRVAGRDALSGAVKAQLNGIEVRLVQQTFKIMTTNLRGEPVSFN
jgi:hypothetical protein